jgi:hypothetical protein
MKCKLQTARLAMFTLSSALTLASIADTVQKPKVLMDARAEPNFDGKEIRGIKLTKIRKNLIYDQAGAALDLI